MAGKNEKNSVRKIVLMGVFWRILIIEGILLIGTLIYAALTEDKGTSELFWYAIRILSLVTIIILFMMITLKKFLTRKIISPLEAIASANRRLTEHDPSAKQVEVDLGENAPTEIKGIVSSRIQMLDTIFKVSDERLRLVNFIRDTFGRYLSKKVVDEILESPDGLKMGGRREIVTILMSDLRGFTSLSENRDPEDMVQLLNRYLERMSKVILEYDGMIDEFIGDAILTVFGVPEKQESDPLRAVACGLAMQNALMELNDELASEGNPILEMGIGINTGSVIVGNIGSEMRTKYGIVGTTINIASRIESNTIGGQVLIGESTYNLVKDVVTVDPPQTIIMKGLKQPLVIYSASAIGAPYNIKLNRLISPENGVEILLPFSFWEVVEGKKIAEESQYGETITLNNSEIIASIQPPPEPLTDIKLIFDFCVEAHCFDDIYAKVLPSDKQTDNTHSRLKITSINQKDREVLNKWISNMS
jgi:class 3 adenylate cyclase